jgi:O-antigen ligase
MILYTKTHKALSFFVCFIPAALVAGAAVMEFFIALTCFTFLFLNFKKIGLNYYHTKIAKFFFVFYLFLVFGSIISEYVVHSIKNTAFYFRYGILILSIWYLLDHYKKFKSLFFYFISFTILVVTIYSFLQIFILHNAVQADRISGLFGTELIQGSYLLRIIPIFIIFYFYNRGDLNKNFRIFFFFTLASAFILIILSGERASIFLMFVGIFLAIFFLRISLAKIFLLILLIFSIFILTIKLYPKSQARIIDSTYNQIFEKSDSSNNLKINLFSEGHQNHFKTAILIFKQNYLTGVGVRNFRLECRKNIYDDVGRYHCTTHPHNTYMQLLSETGLVGFSFFISFIIFILIKMLKFLKITYSNKKKINVPLGVSFVIICINFFPFITTGSFFNNWMSTLYSIPVAILLHELSLKKI